MNFPVAFLFLIALAAAGAWTILSALIAFAMGIVLKLLPDTQEGSSDEGAYGDHPHVPTIEIPSFHSAGE